MLLKFTHLLQMPKFPSHGWILFHGLFHSLYVVYVYDIYIYIIYIHIYLFINLSVDELRSSSHILVIVNNTAINMRVHLSIQYPIWIFLGYISRGRITVHIVVLLLIFYETFILFSIVAELSTFPPSVYKYFLISVSWLTIVFSLWQLS